MCPLSSAPVYLTINLSVCDNSTGMSPSRCKQEHHSQQSKIQKQNLHKCTVTWFDTHMRQGNIWATLLLKFFFWGKNSFDKNPLTKVFVKTPLTSAFFLVGVYYFNFFGENKYDCTDIIHKFWYTKAWEFDYKKDWEC